MPVPTLPFRAALLLALFFMICSPDAGAGEEGLFLWKARSEKATVYLLGSMHAAKPGLYPLDRAILEAWNASPALVVEVNLNDVDMTALQAKLLERGMFGPGERLEDSVSAETRDLLKEYLDSRGMSMAGFSSMRPWFVAMIFTVTELARSGYREDLGIDRHFLDLAAAEGKPVLELESGDFQLDMLSGLDKEMQELFLASTIREIDDFEAHMGRLVDAWKAGDAAAMENLFTESVREDKRLAPVLEKMIYERNVTMAQKIVGYLREGRSCFVVVGAGHLAGKRSIVDLLRTMDSASWKVTRVEPLGRPAPEPAPAEEPPAEPTPAAAEPAAVR